MQYKSTVCDHCNRQLDGLDRCAVVKEKFIVVKGSISVEYVDENQDRKWFYATPNAYDSYTFCDAKCLEEWLANREKMWHDRILTRTPYGLEAEKHWPE